MRRLTRGRVLALRLQQWQKQRHELRRRHVRKRLQLQRRVHGLRPSSKLLPHGLKRRLRWRPQQQQRLKLRLLQLLHRSRSLQLARLLHRLRQSLSQLSRIHCLLVDRPPRLLQGNWAVTALASH